jgi:hypothetical protein
MTSDVEQPLDQADQDHAATPVTMRATRLTDRELT